LSRPPPQRTGRRMPRVREKTLRAPCEGGSSAFSLVARFASVLNLFRECVASIPFLFTFFRNRCTTFRSETRDSNLFFTLPTSFDTSTHNSGHSPRAMIGRVGLSSTLLSVLTVAPDCGEEHSPKIRGRISPSRICIRAHRLSSRNRGNWMDCRTRSAVRLNFDRRPCRARYL
jgi:hypothetical protein